MESPRGGDADAEESSAHDGSERDTKDARETFSAKLIDMCLHIKDSGPEIPGFEV